MESKLLFNLIMVLTFALFFGVMAEFPRASSPWRKRGRPLTWYEVLVIGLVIYITWLR